MRKSALFLAAVITASALTGCTETSEHISVPKLSHMSSESESEAPVSSDTSHSTDTSNSSGAAASSDTKSSSALESTSSTLNASSSSSVKSSSPKTASSTKKLPEKSSSKVYTSFEPELKDGVPEGETLTVPSGSMLEIDGDFRVEGTLDCSEGGLVVVKDGGRLQLDGNAVLNGCMRIDEGGEVCGDGVLKLVNDFDDIDCKGGFTAKIDPPAPIEKNGVTYVGGILLVNKQYAIPKKYGSGLDPELQAAVEEMRKASGFTMRISSGFRSYTEQEWWYNYWCSVDGEEIASTYSALPGHSEHQTGLAADITRSELDYADTPEGKWLAAHSWEYGLIIRYPQDKVDKTGYIYEPWHVRYLGKSTAKLVHDSGLCLEEFLGVCEGSE